MEKFKIVFVESNDSPSESDYYYKDGKLRRVFTFPEAGIKEKNYTTFKKAIPILCSNSISLNDSILHSSSDAGPAISGKVKSIDFEKKEAILFFMENESKIVSFDECFYPIAEVLNELKQLQDRQNVERKDIHLLTVCLMCNQEIQRTTECTIKMDSCKRLNKKTYASIENKP